MEKEILTAKTKMGVKVMRSAFNLKGANIIAKTWVWQENRLQLHPKCHSIQSLYLLGFSFSADFGECTIQGDPEYKTFDKLKHNFSGTSIYVLVRTKNLPENLPAIYIEGTNACTDDDIQNDSSEENRSTSEEDSNEILRLQEVKIKVYNYTVALKYHKKLFVSINVYNLTGFINPFFTTRKGISYTAILALLIK